MVMEAMRLSLLDEEERERKTRTDRERQERNDDASTSRAAEQSRPSTSSEDRQRRRLSGAFRDFFNHSSSSTSIPSLPPGPRETVDSMLPPPLVPRNVFDSSTVNTSPAERGFPPTSIPPTSLGSTSPLRPSPLSNPPISEAQPSPERERSSDAGTLRSITPASERPSYIGLPSDDDLATPAASDTPDADKGKRRQADDNNDRDDRWEGQSGRN
jgi:hypothetical protein